MTPAITYKVLKRFKEYKDSLQTVKINKFNNKLIIIKSCYLMISFILLYSYFMKCADIYLIHEICCFCFSILVKQSINLINQSIIQSNQFTNRVFVLASCTRCGLAFRFPVTLKQNLYCFSAFVLFVAGSRSATHPIDGHTKRGMRRPHVPGDCGG